MGLIQYADPDFRLCRLEFDDLVDLQRRAEDLQWGTRWSSEASLRMQVRDEPVLAMTFMRQHRGGTSRAVRCVVLAALTADPGTGCVVTIDVEPDRVASLGVAVADPDLRQSLHRVFQLALGGIKVVTKA